MVDQSPPPPLPELSRVTIQPGQHLVLTVPEKISRATEAGFIERIKDWWGDAPMPRLLIVDGGARLEATRPAPWPHLTVEDLRAANNRAHDRNVRLSAALIALVEHFERVDACEADKAAIRAACDAWAGTKTETVTDPAYLPGEVLKRVRALLATADSTVRTDAAGNVHQLVGHEALTALREVV